MGEMNGVLVFATVLVPIILALVELLKRTFTIKDNFILLIALVIGVVIGLAATSYTDLDVVHKL